MASRSNMSSPDYGVVEVVLIKIGEVDCSMEVRGMSIANLVVMLKVASKVAKLG